jgi:hypothetical protein
VLTWIETSDQNDLSVRELECIMRTVLAAGTTPATRQALGVVDHGMMPVMPVIITAVIISDHGDHTPSAAPRLPYYYLER